MFSPNPKFPRRPDGKEPKKLTPENKKQLTAIAILTVALLVIYYGIIGMANANPQRFEFLIYGVMALYMVAFTVLLVIYIIYNRAFVNKNVTVDMLPDTWSEEKKNALVEDARIRGRKSRWMLTLLIPFIIFFMVEALYLFVWNGWLGNLVSKL